MDPVSADAILGILGESLPSMFEAASSGGRKVVEQVRIKTGQAFASYLKYAAEKYGSVKTVLYRTKPVPLQDFYIPLKVADAVRKYDTTHVTTLFEIAPFLVITGAAGTGKSTLLKHLFLDCLSAREQVPVFVELRELSSKTNSSLVEVIQNVLIQHGLDVSEEAFKALLKGGKFAFFFDGFDELPPWEADKRAKEILEMIDQFRKNHFILTSRPDTRFIGWHRFTELQMVPLSPEECISMIRKMDYEADKKEGFIDAIRNGLTESHSSFLSNPLLVTIMLMTFDQFGSIPDRMHLFYEQAFDTLYSKHDATKSGFQRIMFSDLPRDQFRNVLSAFSVQAYIERTWSFTWDECRRMIHRAITLAAAPQETDPSNVLNDLLKSVSIMWQDGLKYSFTHRSFQEYFTALFILSMSGQARRQLLNTVATSITNDQVMRLCWEIDRWVVEEEFLVSAMHQACSSAGGQLGDRDWTLRHYDQITVMKDGTWTASLAHNIDWDVLHFSSHVYDNKMWTREQYQGLCPAAARVFELVSDKGNQQSRRSDALTLVISKRQTENQQQWEWSALGWLIPLGSILSDRAVANAFDELCHVLCEARRSGMEILRRINTEQQQRGASIDALLGRIR